MHNTNALLKLDLQLFNGAAAGAGGAAGDGGAAPAAQQTTESALPKAEIKGTRGGSRRGNTGAYDNVVFGKQDAAEGATSSPAAGDSGEGNANKSGISTTSNTLEDKRKAFQELIDGEYKDVYAEQFQQAFNRRFKETKGMEKTIADQKPILDMLMQRYKIEDGDVSKLQAAIEEDSSYWQEAADKEGLTVEQYKAMQKLERENAELRAIRQRQAGEQQAQQQLAKWMQEAEGMKELYPNFDLRAEIANRDFQGLLRSGVPVQKAYELMHMEEIKAAAAKSAAQTASAQMQASIKAKASRPSENGTSSQSAVIVKNDVGNLSKSDRAEIARRVARGEKITF